MSDVPLPVPAPRGQQVRDISETIVRLSRDGVGRGPERARVVIDGDAVVVLLDEALTKAERLLVEHGREAEVLASRRALQDVLRPAYSEAVERITGRKVATLLSTNHTSPDRAAEVFMLAGPTEA